MICVFINMTGTPEGSTESYFDYNGLSLRWIRVIKVINQKNHFIFVFFVKRLL